MHMDVVMVANGRCVTLPISIGCWFIVGMIVTVFVAVMPEMRSVARCVFQCITNTQRCRVSGIQ